jgi:hypothetical protein
MSEEREVPEQRAFSPEEVATMLGVDRATVSSLLADGTLGSKKIGDVQRIFLSDLETYIGEERARSLVRDINSGEEDTRSGPSRKSTPKSSAPEHDDSTDLEFEMEIRNSGDSSRRDQMSQYEPVVQKWSEIDKDSEAIVLADLSEDDVQNIRSLLYRRVGKEKVIVRTAQQEDGSLKAVVRPREDDEYLRE